VESVRPVQGAVCLPALLPAGPETGAGRLFVGASGAGIFAPIVLTAWPLYRCGAVFVNATAG
jgi:hypothetical protein